MDFTEAEIDATFTVRAFWSPDFAVYAEIEEQQPILIAEVTETAGVKWNPSGLKCINKPSPELATAALGKYRRPR